MKYKPPLLYTKIFAFCSHPLVCSDLFSCSLSLPASFRNLSRVLIISCLQALKSGQLPAEFNIGDDNAPNGEATEQEDNMITEEKETNNELKESESEEKKDDTSAMEEVYTCFHLYSLCSFWFSRTHAVAQFDFDKLSSLFTV